MGIYKTFLLIFALLAADTVCANQEALDKAREAAIIQVGLDKAIRNGSTYLQSRLGITKTVKITAGIVKIVRDKSVSLNFQSNSVRLSLNSVEVSYHF